MIKLMFNQKVNYKVLSQDGFKCSKKMLYPIIEELRIALNLLPSKDKMYDIVYSELYNSYISKEVAY